MSFQSWLDVSGERCDKCGKPMNTGDPGVQMRASCKEITHQMVWLHIKCLEKIALRHKEELSERISQ